MFKPLSITLALAAAFPQLLHAEEAAADPARVIVTGSNIRVTEKEGAAAIEVLSAKDIAASGKTSIADVIRALAANSGNSYNEQYTGSFSAGTAGVSLRGLGQKNTLVLVNGKRVSPYATAQDLQEVFVDLNSLPMAAVQRIEVLKDGASSIYGSDAVAGVVNIILYQEFKGTEVTVEGGASTQGTGQTDKRAALQTGFGSLAENGYSLVFALDAQQRSKLQQTDVDWMRGSDFRAEQNGSLAWVPTNYYGTDATRLLGGAQGPLRLTPYGAVSDGKQGQVLAYNPAEYKTLIPAVQRVHASVHGSLQLTPELVAYADLLYSYSRADQTFGAPLSVSSSLRAWNNKSQKLDTIGATLPVGHPNNPGTTPVAITATLFDLGPRLKADKVDFYRALGGVKGQLAGWDVDASLGRSASTLEETVQNFVNRYEFEKVLADGSYNFADQGKNSEAVRNRLRLSTLRPAQSQLTTVDVSAARDLLDLPAGPLGIALGGQWRREGMNSNTSSAVLSGTELRPAINIINGQRDVSALFAEANAPLTSKLNLNVAGRADHYSDFGNAFSPKASLRYEAVPGLLLRGTVSRGFRAPSLPEITNSNSVSYGAVIDPRDPIAPKQARGVTNVTTANAALRPERSDNLNLGFVIAPSSTSSVGVDYYRIKTRGVIGTDNSDTIIAANRPGQVVRDADGRISTLYLQYSNQGDRVVSGVDFDLRQSYTSAGYGKLDLRAQLSRLFRYAAPLSEGEPLTNGAGNNYFGSLPGWRGVSHASWEIGSWSSTLTWNYTSGYDQTSQAARVGEHVSSNATYDLSVSRKLGRASTLTLAVQNLGDKRPSWDSSTAFFDFTQADPRGRFASLKLNTKF
ncbi:TonB-dependent receptor [Duganella sp. HH105]|uniref:TonB-dependent receptor n=1 Tax=Duganella sp. HH105 TaxID=1781067 RepID=UPI000877B755|nr:TonB-dependent receptor [Duganella sp. HH105]OEZ56550.1 colicin I receptor precursor [Duganella sp. HH105]